MTQPMSLMEFLKELLTNVQLRDFFAKDPQGALSQAGLSNLSPADVQDGLILAQDNQTIDFNRGDFSRNYDVGHNTAQYSPPPPPPAAHGYATPAESHQAAADYLTSYVTNNYVDDRSTVVDNSTNQQIDTHGGNFDQNIDIRSATASGDGAVAAGGNITDSQVVTGNDNQVGDGNVRGNANVVGDHNQAVSGDANTTAFGSGAATSTHVGGDVNVGAGGAFGSGGTTTVDNTDNSLHNVGNDYSNHSINDSFQDSSNHAVTDSGNTTLDSSVHDSNNDNSHTTTEGSFNDQSDHSQHLDTTQTDVGNIHI